MISATEDHFVLPVSLAASLYVSSHHSGFCFRRHA